MSEPAFVPADPDLNKVERELQSRYLAGKAELAEEGIHIRETEGLRDPKRGRQAYLYALGRTLPGKIVTNAKPGRSMHETGRAIDFCFDLPKGQNPYGEKLPWARVGEVMEKHGLKWGGRFSRIDRPHVELKEA